MAGSIHQRLAALRKSESQDLDSGGRIGIHIELRSNRHIPVFAELGSEVATPAYSGPPGDWPKSNGEHCRSLSLLRSRRPHCCWLRPQQSEQADSRRLEAMAVGYLLAPVRRSPESNLETAL